jgi:hypothetical protein
MVRITVRYAGKLIRACAFCTEPINKGEPIFVLWQFKSGKTFLKYWHFERDVIGGKKESCYLEYQRMYLAQHPYIPKERKEKEGPRLNLNSEERKKRLSLLARASFIRAEIRDFTFFGLNIKVTELHEKLDKIEEKLESLGGVPNTKAWRKW